MASSPQQPSDVELRRSEVSQPSPLRIVKRRQTVAGYSSSGALVDGGWDLSASPDDDRGSPRAGPDRPLTVQKTRKTRGSILDGSQENGSGQQSPRSAILGLIGRNSPWRTREDVPAPNPEANNNTPVLEDQDQNISRSRKLLLKSVPGRTFSGSAVQKTIRRISSNITKRIKRPSRAEQNSSSFYGGDANINLSAMSCSDHADIHDAGGNIRLSFHAPTTPNLPIMDSLYTPGYRRSFILCPQITVIPDTTVVDISVCSIWVAVEVTGILRRADGNEEYGNGAERYPTHSYTQSSDLKCYGRLHSMRLDLVPGQDCMVSEIFGNLRNLKTLGAKETYLVLVKVRFGAINPAEENAGHIAAPDDLIARLEGDLSHITAPFLTVRITYKHSGIPDQKPGAFSQETGISSFATRVQSEATAVIQRTNLQSRWSPQASQNTDDINPLIKMIETHFTVEKARGALRRLANDRVQIPPARRRLGNHSQQSRSSDGTPISARIGSIAARLDAVAAVPIKPNSMGMDGTADSPNKQDGTVHDRDPARKIWSEMRRASRCDGRSCTPKSIENQGAQNCPARIDPEAAVEGERHRIKETALKNERSLGADSLRSMAPSSTSTDSTPPSPGLGSSLKSAWNWGGSWW